MNTQWTNTKRKVVVVALCLFMLFSLMIWLIIRQGFVGHFTTYHYALLRMDIERTFGVDVFESEEDMPIIASRLDGSLDDIMERAQVDLKENNKEALGLDGELLAFSLASFMEPERECRLEYSWTLDVEYGLVLMGAVLERGDTSEYTRSIMAKNMGLAERARFIWHLLEPDDSWFSLLPGRLLGECCYHPYEKRAVCVEACVLAVDTAAERLSTMVDEELRNTAYEDLVRGLDESGCLSRFAVREAMLSLAKEHPTAFFSLLPVIARPPHERQDTPQYLAAAMATWWEMDVNQQALSTRIERDLSLERGTPLMSADGLFCSKLLVGFGEELLRDDMNHLVFDLIPDEKRDYFIQCRSVGLGKWSTFDRPYSSAPLASRE